jgi:hypothetical protein
MPVKVRNGSEVWDGMIEILKFDHPAFRIGRIKMVNAESWIITGHILCNIMQFVIHPVDLFPAGIEKSEHTGCIDLFAITETQQQVAMLQNKAPALVKPYGTTDPIHVKISDLVGMTGLQENDAPKITVV